MEYQMANAVTTQKPSQLATFVDRMITGERQDQIAAALPSHVSYEEFRAAFMNAVMQSPDLMKCDASALFREISTIAGLGLLLDPVMGEAWVFPTSSGPQHRIGYRGLMKLADQSGKFKSIYSHVVHEGDEVVVNYGINKKLEHTPATPFGDKGDIIGVYAVAHLANGTSDFELMTRGEVEEIRDKFSQGWKSKKGKGPWADAFGEMARKTVLHRFLKRLPQSRRLREAVAHDDAIDFDIARMELQDVTPAPTARPLPPPADGGRKPPLGVEADGSTTVEAEAAPVFFLHDGTGKKFDKPLEAEDFVTNLEDFMTHYLKGRDRKLFQASFEGLLQHNSDNFTNLPDALRPRVDALIEIGNKNLRALALADEKNTAKAEPSKEPEAETKPDIEPSDIPFGPDDFDQNPGDDR